MRKHAVAHVGKPSRWPILAAAILQPGSGQLLQGRWRAALFFGIGFMACAVPFLVQVVMVIVDYYRLAFDWDADVSRDGIAPMTWVLFILALVVYVASLLDVARAYGRACRKVSTGKAEEIILRATTDRSPDRPE